MSSVAPGWYKDPADPTTQRWWDGEGWLGDPIPADATPPEGPPPVAPEPPPAPVAGPATIPAGPPAAVPVPPGAHPGQPGAGHAPGQPGPVGMPVPWVAGPYPTAPIRPHGLMLAGVGSRFMARLVDVLAVLVLAAIANVWFAVEFWRSFRPVWEWAMAGPQSLETIPRSAEQAGEMIILMSIVLTAVWFAYEVPAMANSGQTLGKRIFGIRVVKVEADERLGFGRSFRRWFRLAWPTPFWLVCYGLPVIIQFIDCLFVAIDRRLHQALHDRISHTVVVQVPRPSRPETARVPVDNNPASTGHPSNPIDRL